jgi:hypothetical protein
MVAYAAYRSASPQGSEKGMSESMIREVPLVAWENEAAQRYDSRHDRETPHDPSVASERE